MKLNLNKQVLIIILISVMFTFGTVLFVNNKLFLDVFKEQFHEKINFIGNEFTKSAALSLLLNRKEILIKRSESIIKDKDIIGVKVINKQKKVILKRGVVKGYRVVFPILLKQFSEANLFEGSEKVTAIGEVELYYTRENIKNVMIKVFLLSFSISFMIAVIIFLFAYKVLSKNFLKPLTFWQDNIENEKKLLNYYNKMGRFTAPEIEKLYSVFLDMLGKLKENYKKMAQQQSLAEIGNFSLTVAHEIKNPLGIIKGAFDIFRKENIDGNTKKEMVQYIEEEIKRIDKLIKDFLMMSKNINVNLSEFTVNDIIANIVEKAKINYPSVSIKFAYKKNVKAITDNDMLNHIISNLIKNCVEAKSTVVNILLGTNDKKWFIKIIDNGIGINDNDKKKIFEPFFTTKNDGSGIGLTYVVKAVYQLNGNISFESEAGKGTSFYIEFDKGKEING